MKLRYEEHNLLLKVRNGSWFHPYQMGENAAERFYLERKGLLETSHTMMLVTNYRITEAGRKALDAAVTI